MAGPPAGSAVVAHLDARLAAVLVGAGAPAEARLEATLHRLGGIAGGGRESDAASAMTAIPDHLDDDAAA